MTDRFDFLTVAFAYAAAIIVIFMFGFMFGREHQCYTMDAAYVKGKCMKVAMTEVKP